MSCRVPRLCPVVLSFLAATMRTLRHQNSQLQYSTRHGWTTLVKH
jgi:hypothetical protein